MGPPTTKGSYEFQSDYLRRTYDVLDRLEFMNGSIYWPLRDFAVASGVAGRRRVPAGLRHRRPDPQGPDRL